MEKAEKFISEHTRKLTQYGHDYFLWVTPDDAKKAVEIAREESIEKVKALLLSEVLPCFMHGGEADEVVTMLDEKLLKDDSLEETDTMEDLYQEVLKRFKERNK